MSLTEHESRRRRRWPWMRSLILASAAAFAGGVAVVIVQYVVSQASAGYPPVVEALLCGPEGEEPAVIIGSSERDGAALPIVEMISGTRIECRLEAPNADYATWRVIGPRSGSRSGRIDRTLPCQSPEDFSRQSTSNLKLGTCQRASFDRVGLYLVSVAVMTRGHPLVDRTMLAIRVQSPTTSSKPLVSGWNVRVSLQLPARQRDIERTAELSASYSEHGLLPKSRYFVRSLYTLPEDEEYVAADFRARSADNASAVVLSYIPKSRTVTAGFTLRSGPIVDRWRGWISGTVIIRVQKHETDRKITLREESDTVPGQVSFGLPEGIDAAGAKILVSDLDTDQTVEVPLVGTFKLGKKNIITQAEQGRLVFKAMPDQDLPR